MARLSVKAAAKDVCTSILGEGADLSAIADVAVSFDGSWSTRGFSSKYGFCCVISVNFKKVILELSLSSCFIFFLSVLFFFHKNAVMLTV